MKNEPAFPTDHDLQNPAGLHNKVFSGLTKREYFAAMAMQGILSHCARIKGTIEDRWQGRYAVAEMATAYATALAEELERSK